MQISDCQKAIDVANKIRTLKANRLSIDNCRLSTYNVKISGTIYSQHPWGGRGQDWAIDYPMNVADVRAMIDKDIAQFEKQLFDLGVKADA